MIKNILVPLDGSSLAEEVLPYVRLLAGKTGARVELLRVTDDDAPGPLAVAGDYLKQTAGRALANLSAVECTAIAGKAAEMIVDRAERMTDCTIALATRGASGIRAWLVGSVALKVVQAAVSPLLLVRADGVAIESVAMNSIIVALDGSELAECVIDPAVELAQRLECEIVLARAWELPASAYYREAGDQSAAPFIPTYDQLVAATRRETDDYLAAKLAQLRDRGVTTVRTAPLQGAAAEQIVALAQRTSASLIALCTHGRSGLSRWALGSVMEKVVQRSQSPMLIIRAR